MARALIVGCGCRGTLLAEKLIAEGWVVRGTTRDPARADALAAVGIEAATADPDRPGEILELVGDVAVIVWALASASGPADAVRPLHGSRLERLLEHLVDTPVRGFVYEAVGRADPESLAAGTALVAEAGERWRIPTALIECDPGDTESWVLAGRHAVARALAGG